MPLRRKPWQTPAVHPIDVVGVGVRSPFGVGPDRLFAGLCSGRPTYGRYEPFVRAGLEYPLAAPLPEGCLADVGDEGAGRGKRLLEAVVRDALADATGSSDLSRLHAPAQRVGLFVGTSSAGLDFLTQALTHSNALVGEPRYAWETEQVARSLGVAGQVQVLCSVCAAGSQAVAEAASWLCAGSVDVAIAAGYDVLEPFVAAGFDVLGATSDRALPFRAERSGLVLGEAGAALVLVRPNEHSLSLRGTVEGWASASDAFHVTAPHPEGLGLACATRAALAVAHLEPKQIDVINAHGTATVYNDQMESRAFCNVFGARAGHIPLHTVKGTIGHTLGAAGAVEAVVALTSMREGVIPPTCTEGPEDPGCDVDLVMSPRHAHIRRTLSASAGFGGFNCVLVLGGAS